MLTKLARFPCCFSPLFYLFSASFLPPLPFPFSTRTTLFSTIIMPLPLPSLLILLLTTCSQLTNASCFLPNGTDINRLRLGPVPYDRWLPCNNNGGMCCRLNDTNPDTCTDQGLCHNDVAPTLWRESCTERDWGGACLQLCVGASGINTGNPNW